MPVQTSYNQFPATAILGMLADSSPAREVVTRLAEGDVNVGRVIVSGTAYPQAKEPDVTGDIAHHKLEGISLYDAAREPGAPHYGNTDPITTLRKGRVWVSPQGAVTANGPVFVVHSGANAGRIRADADTAAATVATSFIRVLQGAAADGLALVEINLP